MGNMRVFVLDDDKWYRDFIKYHLELNPDLDVSVYASARELKTAFSEKPDVICLDFDMPDATGGELMREAMKEVPDSEIVMISGQDDVGTAVQLLKSGAYDYITKDDETGDRLWNTILKIKEKRELQDEVKTLRKEVKKKYDNGVAFVGSSNGITKVQALIEKASTTNISVSIFGETGTGKELIARAIHNVGNRSGRPMIKVNCAALPKDLIESELFGHVKGSFTGALRDRDGKFELADGGTLFLDEIGEMPLELQPKLLRALQEGEIEKVGGNNTIKVNVRIIAATNKRLKEEVEKGNFREDLFFRLNVFPVQIPPLRERKEDIPILTELFLSKYTQKHGKKIDYIEDASREFLQSYEWPGNVRELENLIERAVIVSNHNTLTLTPSNQADASKKRINQLNLTLDEVQRDYIVKILNECNWTIGGEDGAASRLGLKPSTLRDRMSKLDINRPD